MYNVDCDFFLFTLMYSTIRSSRCLGRREREGVRRQNGSLFTCSFIECKPKKDGDIYMYNSSIKSMHVKLSIEQIVWNSRWNPWAAVLLQLSCSGNWAVAESANDTHTHTHTLHNTWCMVTKHCVKWFPLNCYNSSTCSWTSWADRCPCRCVVWVCEL